MSGEPDYYEILGIAPDATPVQIRKAYKIKSLKSHPDRVPVDSPERESRTREFQRINDAYYTLSDPDRRQRYDNARKAKSTGASSTDEDSSNGGVGGFPWSAFSFGGSDRDRETRDSRQFGSVFEEMLREEGLASDEQDGTGQARAMPTKRFWSIIGALSGGALGFIVANFPGAVAGAVAGNRLGAVRDAKGKSVYEVFLELPQSDRARLLSELASRVLQSAVNSR
ncbi:hypothetical protein VTN31DRAFT_6817 [Thermomyces dupontii]|uniref:uncharacterized protein n=1 Tax=Talaromyces thermophilus TaxID=28565 RepID=UPI00374226A4